MKIPIKIFRENIKFYSYCIAQKNTHAIQASRRDATHAVQLTPHKPSGAVWWMRHPTCKHLIACNMLAKGLAPTLIAEITGLTEKEILALVQK